MKYILKYLDNLHRELIGEFECDSEPYDAAKELLSEHGYVFREDVGHWLSYPSDADNEVEIVYSEVVAPHNSAGLYVKDGYCFEIHTDEDIHKNTCHVHVSWANGDISVRLDNYKVVKKTGTRESEIKHAIKIIKSKESDFQKAWNYIIKDKNVDKAYALFKK